MHKIKPGYSISNRPVSIIILLLIVLLTALNFYRILNIPITHDEGITWYDYIRLPYSEIIFTQNPSANNHILNTILAKFFTGLGGDNQLMLRLPNLLAQLLYLIYGWLLLKLLSGHSFWIISGLLLLNLNPFLFDFWGLCRGYGLSWAFMMGSIYYLFQYNRRDQYGFLCLSLVMGMLAVWSNLATMNYFVGLAGVAGLDLLFRIAGKKEGIKKAAPTVTAMLASFIILYFLLGSTIQALKNTNQLYFGGSTGFVTDTMGSIIKESFYLAPDRQYLVATICTIIILLMAVAGIKWIIAIVKKGWFQETNQRGMYLWLLVMIPVISIVVQFYLSGTLFLIERTALFLYPLFILQLIYFLQTIRQERRPFIVIGSTILLTLICGINFYKHLSLSSTKTWHFDRWTLVILDRMKYEQEHDPKKISVRTDWLFAPSYRFYTCTSYGDYFLPVEDIRSELSKDSSFDYYMIYKHDLSLIPSNYHADTVIDGHLVLMKKD